MKHTAIGSLCLFVGLISCAKNDSDIQAMAGFSQPAWLACAGNLATEGWPVSDVTEQCYESQSELWCSDVVIENLQTHLHQCCAGAKGQFYKINPARTPEFACKLPEGDIKPGWLRTNCIARGGSVLSKLPSVLIPSEYGYCEPYGGYDQLRQERAEQNKEESFAEFNKLG